MFTQRIPLLKDCHNHPLFYTSLHNRSIDIRYIKDKNIALNLFKDLNPNKISIILGWLNNYYTFSNNELDRYGPLIIFNSSMHSFILNTPAKEILKTKYPVLIDNCNNEIWVEKNLTMVLDFVVAISSPDINALKFFYDYLLGLGIYYAEEMTLHNEQEITLFEEADLSHRTRFWTSPASYEKFNPEIKEKTHGVKLFIDGAMGARTAKLKYGYRDNRTGILNYTKRELYEVLSKIQGFNKPISLHAIGDEAIDLAVNTVSSMNAFPDVRIEHALLISKDTAKRAKDHGIKLCMQPNFSIETKNYADRLNSKYCESINPFRMLIDEIGYRAGDDLIFGSDGMPHGVKNALEMSLYPPLDKQRLKIEEVINGYCMEGFSHGSIDVKVDKQSKKIECEINISQRAL